MPRKTISERKKLSISEVMKALSVSDPFGFARNSILDGLRKMNVEELEFLAGAMNRTVRIYLDGLKALRSRVKKLEELEKGERPVIERELAPPLPKLITKTTVGTMVDGEFVPSEDDAGS